MLILLLLSALPVVLNVQLVDASGSIYIRADGSISPSTADITTTDNFTYTFNDNVYYSIVVERNDIVIDGKGYTLQGKGSGNGIELRNRKNVKVQNTIIKAFTYGIYLHGANNICMFGNDIMTNNNEGIYLEISNNNDIFGNNIANNEYGMSLYYCSNCSICGNNITANNREGIFVFRSSNNRISANNITGNIDTGIYTTWDLNNTFCHNNMNNTRQVVVEVFVGQSAWDDGYPSGGNHWSDYAGVDLLSGPFQNETGCDGIGDTPYAIDAENKDNYPRLKPWTIEPFKTDINNDGKVNILDITLVAKAFGNMQGDPKWNEAADLDKNGQVNIIDISMVAKDHGKTV